MRIRAIAALATMSLTLTFGLSACAAAEPEPASGGGPEVIKLWPGPAPGSESWTVKETTVKLPVPSLGMVTLVRDVSVPTLTVYRPAPGKANGTAVIVAPGGGFQFHVWDLEGTEVAQWLADRGVTAFVLKYRVRAPDPSAPKPPPPTNFEEALKQGEPQVNLARADAIEAIRLVRGSAKAYGIDPKRVGLMGFSAGAMTTMSVILKAEPADRPDFGVPVYGAMEDVAVPKAAPPLFILATRNDAMVPVAQSVKIFTAWNAVGAPAELHLYEDGPHGFGLRPLGTSLDGWSSAFETWLRARKLLDRR